MTRAQYKALHDYANEFGYTTREILKELKANGTVAPDCKLDDLGDYVGKGDYATMFNFLADNL